MADPSAATDDGEPGSGSGSDSGRSERPTAGVVVGRYVLLSRLGAGGMGEVWAAYDPELDRRVALKLLLRSRRSQASRLRLLREAQALAKLSHPNVVTIHDVGTWAGQVWIAMEFVEGQTLGEWLGKRKPSWREIVDVLRAAGLGLSAAHAKGLIHRDFKPENVMVDEEGRVRVMDFGLARAEGELQPLPPGSTSESRDDLEVSQLGLSDSQLELSALSSAELNPLRSSLTLVGSLMGTPAYMGPEQFSGLETGPASDQFGFCVTLWEALYGERPFASETLAGLSLAILEGQRREAPSGSKVPGWVRRVITRGLETEVDKRWPSMDALLDALDKDPRVARRRALVPALLAGALVGVFSWGRLDRQATSSQCEAVADAAAQLWTADMKARSRETFAASELSYADETWTRVDAGLQLYLDEWAEVRTQVCLDTELDHARTPESRALVDACLDERWTAALRLRDALVETEPDPKLIQRAVQAVAALPSIERCTDERWLTSRAAPPDDPALQLEVASLRQSIEAIAVLSAAGRYELARDEAKALEPRARDSGWPPILAELELAQASVTALSGDYEEARSILQAAFERAAKAGHDELAGLALAKLTFVAGTSLARHDEALRWSALAEIFLTRAAALDSLSAATWHNAAGLVYQSKGELDEATIHAERALAIWRAKLGERHHRVGVGLNSLGNIYRARQDPEAALDAYERSLAIREGGLGPTHPLVATPLNNIGTLAFDHGDYGEALSAYQRALHIREAVFGPEHPGTAFCLNNVGMVQMYQGHYEAAQASLERALAIREATLGPDHALTSTTLNNLAAVHRNTSEFEAALPLAERALAIRERSYGPEHTKVAGPLKTLASVLVGLDRPDEARPLLVRALTILEAKTPTVSLGEVLIDLASLDLGRGELAMALAQGERGLEVFAGLTPPRPKALGDARFVLAKIRAAQDDAAGAAREARASLEHYAQIDESASSKPLERRVAEVEAWFEALPKDPSPATPVP